MFDHQRHDRRWPLIWWARHAIPWLAAVLVCFLIFLDRERAFLGLVGFFTLGSLAFALRAADDRITWPWWMSLIGFMGVFLTVMTATVLVGPGEGRFCPDRVEGDRWSVKRNIGPSPWCLQGFD